MNLKQLTTFFVISVCACIPLLAQDNVQYALPADSSGGFTEATGFCFNELGDVYIIQAYNGKIFKMQENGSLVKEAGGFGWSMGLFDNASSITSGILKIYVADQNNHRVQIFDRELTIIGSINRDEKNDESLLLRQPSSLCTNSLGELFILSKENKVVLKCSPDGTPLQSFGGNNYGSFSLQNPTAICGYESGVCVLDENRLCIFDRFGNSSRIIPLNNVVNGISEIKNGKLLLLEENALVVLATDTMSSFRLMLPPYLHGKIISISFYNKMVYCLTSEQLYWFSPGL